VPDTQIFVDKISSDHLVDDLGDGKLAPLIGKLLLGTPWLLLGASWSSDGSGPRRTSGQEVLTRPRHHGKRNNRPWEI